MRGGGGGLKWAKATEIGNGTFCRLAPFSTAAYQGLLYCNHSTAQNWSEKEKRSKLVCEKRTCKNTLTE